MVSDIDTFLAKPEAYLSEHPVSFGLAGLDEADYFIREPRDEGAGDLIAITDRPGKRLSVIVKAKGAYEGTVGLLLTGGDTEKGIRYLPWVEKKLTYRVLDPGAEWLFTGPLQGCYIYIAEDADGRTSVLHVNANDMKDEVENARVKDEKVARALEFLPPGSKVTHRLPKSDYWSPDQIFNAFVVGRLRDGRWRFMVHTVLFRMGKTTTAEILYGAKEF